MTLFRTCSVAAASFLLLAAAAFAAPPAKVALRGGRIIPVTGDEIAKGTVLIENGKIAAVGPDADVQIPFDAMEVDCTGKVLFPGMIDPHSARGLDVPNENVPVAPFLNVYDAIDPSRLFFEDLLRDGVTTVHVMVANECVVGGVSRVVRPIGMTVDEMTTQPDVAMKFSTSPRAGTDRMTQLSMLREAFLELEESAGRLAEKKYEDSLKKDKKDIDVGPAEAKKRGRGMIEDSDYDDKHLNLIKVKRGDMGSWFYCGAATDVAPAIRVATDEGILENTVFVLGPESYKAVGELKKAKRPVVLDAELFHRERDELTGRIKETFVPAKVHEAGLAFALQPNANASMAERYLNYQAAVCVRNGVPRQTALESITVNPAKFLGLGDRLGSIETGKTANIVVFSGDPLDFNSWVELVYIDGIRAYERSKDKRIESLMKLDQQNAEKREKEKAKQAAESKPKEGAKPDADKDAKPADETKPAGESKPGEGSTPPSSDKGGQR